ncbi:MAG: AgmX/PglI C-terminal domain-containing protein [Oligoflexia bacterium]|nr:AgmX/PglI C-terminal domain-containing protein [Oligoflexia bacterium]
MDHGEQGPNDETVTETSRNAPLARKAALFSLEVPAGGAPLEADQQRVFRLGKERIVVGSVVSADVRLLGKGVAPLHAVVEITGALSGEPEATVYDLASDSGVFVNGRKIVTGALKPGDLLRVGPHELRFSISDAEKVVPRERVREAEGRKLYLNPDEDLAPLLLQSDGEVDKIFDFSPCRKRALAVVMSWHGTIIDVEHFVKEKSVTVGANRRSDFAIPPLLSSSRYAIVTRSGEDFVLNLDPQMKGVIQRKGKLETFEGIREGASVAGPQSYGIPIGNEDFAKVSIGDVDFYLSYTDAPPRVKAGRLLDRDPFFLRVFATSLLFTAVTIGAMLNANVPQNLEAEQIPERIATILYQPEKYSARPKRAPEPSRPEPVRAETARPQPKPTQVAKLDLQPNPANAKKPVPKEMNVGAKPEVAKNPGGSKKKSPGQREAKEGRGARAKGTEGKRGSPKAAPGDKPQDRAMRASAQGGPGRGGGASQVESIGNVDFLSSAGAKISDILGNSAEKLGKGGERLKGFGGFTTQGGGGLALSGDGKGGGGTADSLGGLATSGTGGGRVGTGKGAAGLGSGMIGGKARVAIRTGGPEEAVVMGSIDASAVEAALLAHRDEFRLCYEKEINAETPDLAGRVSTSFVIGSTGRVTQAGIESTTLKHANTERCVLNVIRRIDFPIPRGAGIVQVTYPFKFNPTRR